MSISQGKPIPLHIYAVALVLALASALILAWEPRDPTSPPTSVTVPSSPTSTTPPKFSIGERVRIIGTTEAIDEGIVTQVKSLNSKSEYMIHFPDNGDAYYWLAERDLEKVD
jgi:hypothetical protein